MVDPKFQYGRLDADTKLTGPYLLRIYRKNIKHIYFRIYPQKKQVIVSAPLQVRDLDLDAIIRSKMNWINRQIAKAGSIKNESAFHFICREKIVFQGRQLSLEIKETTGKTGIFFDEESLVLTIQPGSHHDQKTRKIDQWLRQQLKFQIKGLVEKWEPVLDVHIKEYRVRKMKTRWGTCNIQAKRIWLNQVLVHLSPCYLEYVVVHEMVHLLERKHNARFKRFMDQYIPDWRDLKRQLKKISI